MGNKAQVTEYLKKAAAALETPAPAADPNIMAQTMNSAQDAIRNAQAYFLANRRAAALGAGGLGALAGAGLGYGIGGNWQSALAGGLLGGGLGGAGMYYGFPCIPGAQMPAPQPTPEQMSAMKAASAHMFLKRALQEGVLPAEQTAQVPAQVEPGMMDQFTTGLQNFGQDLAGYGQQAWQGMRGLGQDAQQAAMAAGNYMAANPYAAAAAGAGLGAGIGAGIGALAGGDAGDIGMGALLGAGAGGLGGYFGAPYMGQPAAPQMTPEQMAAAGIDPATAQATQQLIDEEAMKQAQINQEYIRKYAGLPNMIDEMSARGLPVPADPAALAAMQRRQEQANLAVNYARMLGAFGPGLLGAGAGAGIGAGLGALAGQPGYGAAIGAGLGGAAGLGYGAYAGHRGNQLVNEELLAALDAQQKQARADAYIEDLVKKAAIGDEAAQEALETIAPAAAEVADELDEVSDAVAEVAAMDPNVVQAAQVAISSPDPNEANQAAAIVSDAMDTVAAGALTDNMTAQLVDEVAMKAAAGYQYLSQMGLTKQAINLQGAKGMIMGLGTGAKTWAGQLVKSVGGTYKRVSGKISPMADAVGGQVRRHPYAYGGGALGAAGMGGAGYAGYNYMNQPAPAPVAPAGQKMAGANDAYINNLVKIAGKGEAAKAAIKKGYEAVAGSAKRGAEAAIGGAKRGAEAVGRGASAAYGHVRQHPYAYGAGALGAGAAGVGGYMLVTLPDGTPAVVPAGSVAPMGGQPPMA